MNSTLFYIGCAVSWAAPFLFENDYITIGLVLLWIWLVIWTSEKRWSEKFRKKNHATEQRLSYWKKSYWTLEENFKKVVKHAEEWDEIIWTLASKFSEEEINKIFLWKNYKTKKIKK